MEKQKNIKEFVNEEYDRLGLRTLFSYALNRILGSIQNHESPKDKIIRMMFNTDYKRIRPWKTTE
jgi:hypothetical protein